MVCLLIELDGEVIEKILTGRQIRRSILFTSTQDVMAIAFRSFRLAQILFLRIKMASWALPCSYVL
jgi:hypothetical protein